MKTNIKLWTMGLMTAALLGNTACTDLLHESYGQVVSEDYVPKTEEDVSYLVNAAYIPWRETLLQWNGVVRAQELCADQDVLPARDGIGWVDGYIYKRWHQHTWTTEDDGVLQGWERTYNGVNTCNRIFISDRRRCDQCGWRNERKVDCRIESTEGFILLYFD